MQAFSKNRYETGEFLENSLTLFGCWTLCWNKLEKPSNVYRPVTNYTDIMNWEAVLSIPNITFINLQSTDFKNDLRWVQDNFGITVHNFEDLDHYDNLDDVAALCKALDICISVSTAVSAIASGVGTPTKVLSWKQSPWNNSLLLPCGPSVNTYERNTWEPWSNILEKVATDLQTHHFKDE